MKIQNYKATCFLYFIVIISVYFMEMSVIPLELAWAINKIFYLSLGLLFLQQAGKVKRIIKGSWLPLLFLFLYIVFYLSSVMVVQTEGISFGEIASKSFFYIVIFTVFCSLVYELDFKDLLFPFFIGTLIIIFLSLPPLFGYEYTYYSMDEGRLAARIAAIKSSLQATGFARYPGVYTNQNGFGLVLVVGLGISLALYCDYTLRSFKYNRFQLFFIIVAFISSLLFALITLSRASLLAVFIILSIFSYKTLKNKRVLVTVFIFTILSIVFLYLNKEILDLIFYRFTSQGT